MSACEAITAANVARITRGISAHRGAIMKNGAEAASGSDRSIAPCPM